MISFKAPASMSRQVKLLALDQERLMRDLPHEAIENLFVKHEPYWHRP